MSHSDVPENDAPALGDGTLSDEAVLARREALLKMAKYGLATPAILTVLSSRRAFAASESGE